ncbi:MAG: S-layer homology domain-containing protein, partial [Oscillospiraceae bacterium]|nr:S-layer homology domain-containing protein [Oscillospiraceae bacterium]
AAGVETRTCSRCDAFETRPVEALGHDYQAVVTEPTCTEGGYTTYTCSRCGDSYVADETAALGHDYNAVVTEPTCTEIGYTTHTCSRCGDSYEDSTVAVLGHDWGEPVVTVKPSYQFPGQQSFTCTRCGETKTEELPRLENPFVDVHDEDFFFNPVMWALDNGVTGGVDSTHFGPRQDCTREQIVTFLWRANGSPEPEATENPFSDLKAGAYFYKAVLWAVENHVTGGIGNGKFGVGISCTRAQAMTFLWAAKGSPEPETTENPFTDVKAGAYYFKAVLWATGHDPAVTGGVGGGRFAPDQICSRSEIITFLYKIYEN